MTTREPEQLELPLELPQQESTVHDDDDQYMWKQFMREEADEQHSGCLPVILLVVVLWMFAAAIWRSLS